MNRWDTNEEVHVREGGIKEPLTQILLGLFSKMTAIQFIKIKKGIFEAEL